MITGFLGAGKVGHTLGKYLSSRGITVAGYYDRDTEYASSAAQFTGTKNYEDKAKLICQCDVLFLTVPDNLIYSVFKDLTTYPIRAKFLCHCSGALSSKEAFPGIEKTGAFGFSVHPLFAVSDKYHAYEELQDVFFTLEGDNGHLAEMRDMLKISGLKVITIDASVKKKYHLAASIASNQVVALIDESVNLLKQCGFGEDEALAALKPLVLGNAKHVMEMGSIASLTGPVERADTETIRKHLDVLINEEDKLLYALLSKRLTSIAKAKHSDRSYDELDKLLESMISYCLRCLR